MSKKPEGGHRKNFIIFASVVVIATICILAFISKVTPFEQNRKIMVCEIDRRLFVTIDESDFNRDVYSKNLDDCR